MPNAGLDEAQAGIKIVRRNANNLDTQMIPPLWQKVKKSLLMRVKKESEKAGLKQHEKN